MNEAVSIVALQGNSVYLGRRLKPGATFGKLGFPGGKKEPGETPEQGASREYKEETGRTGEAFVPLGVMEFYNGDLGQYRSFGFLVEVPPGAKLKNVERDKHEDWVAVPIPRVMQLSDDLLLPGTKQFVRAAAEARGIKV